ncbi:ABC transporter ATP-binding protein [Azospirillum sp. ST 5-10]|uniref:ABC transporter ATP-binding protein n=1 Tax=unclassified Azospirillum TaxID=2630922 RepID=UPI003F49D84C
MTLAAESLAFGYPGKPVGADVGFTVAPAEVLVLLGPNGSGKTTLFKTLLGLLPPRGGRVLVDGHPLDRLRPADRARALGYVPQASAGTFPFTVLDTVLMGRAARLGLFAAPSRGDRAVALAALERLGIADLAGEPYTRISGGQRQLALFARALAQEARFLVMDEPTASLDFGNQVRVLRHVRALARSGIGVVLSTHDPGHAFQVGHRVALLRDGRLTALGAPEATITAASLKELYGVDTVVDAVWDAAGGRRVHVSVPLLGAPGG